MAGLVRTVLGDVDPTSLGITLVHEHLVVDWGELQGRPKLAFEFEPTVERISQRLVAAREHGVGAIGECTPIGTGRYVDVLVAAARRSGVAIIGATGFFHEGWTPVHPIAKALDVDALTDLYVRELTEGMGSTTVRAGLIKCATGEATIGPLEEKMLRATARAHRATGAPIVAHITDSLEAEQLDVFESEGVDPARICISHVGGGARWQERMLGALRRGANVSVDMISYAFAPDEQRIEVAKVALDAGFIRQLMLSHDALVVQNGPEALFGEGPSDFSYIPRLFVPKLRRAAGIGDPEIRIILEENPQRFLARV
jgi:predicted metal-dependent phosphotriesterase family hydrolase